MERKIISLDGQAPSPLWVRARGPKPPDWQERLLAYICSQGARELLIAVTQTGSQESQRTRHLIGALIALRKLGLTLERWLDGLDVQAERETDALWRRALADEQGTRQRLAWELLIELIGFSRTDSPEYWDHHAALVRLQHQAAKLADVETFFSCRPASLVASVLDAADDVAAYEGRLGERLSMCWYARRRTPTTTHKIVKSGLLGLSTQRSRFRLLLEDATATERVALGVTYQRLYSRLSRRVHFSVMDPHDFEHADSARGHGDGEISNDELRWGATVVGRLGTLCLARLQQLTGLPGGAVCRLNQEARDNQVGDAHEDMLFTIAAGHVRVGDFALVHERLTEVCARETNELGHARYLVAYVTERPRPDIEEEWQPATEVHTLWDRTKLEGWLDQGLAEATDEQRATFLMLRDDQRLRAYARAIWEAGLRDQVLAQLHEAPPVSFS